MADFATIKKTLIDWVKAEGGVDDQAVILAFQNGPVPTLPYFVLRILSIGEVGDATFIPAETPTDLGDQDMVTTLDFTLEILGFGPDIVEKTLNLKNSLNKPSVHETLVEGGVISWNSTERVLDVSGIDNHSNEERSSYDAFMRTVEIVSNIPSGAIEIVNTEGTLKQPGKPDVSIDVNVDTTI